MAARRRRVNPRARARAGERPHGGAVVLPRPRATSRREEEREKKRMKGSRTCSGGCLPHHRRRPPWLVRVWGRKVKQIRRSSKISKFFPNPNPRSQNGEEEGTYLGSFPTFRPPSRGKKDPPPPRRHAGRRLSRAVRASPGRGHHYKPARRRRAHPRANARASEESCGGAGLLFSGSLGSPSLLRRALITEERRGSESECG